MPTVDLPFTDLIEEAYDRAGIELRSGYDMRSARRSLNLMLNDWNNKGLNLWTVDSGTISVVSGTKDYTLPADTVDLLEHVIRNSDNQDYTLYRVTVSTYAHQTNKSSPGRPTQIYIQRTDPPTVTLWPEPNEDFTLVYWRLRRMDGLVSGIDGSPDVPSRFLQPLVSGLAYYTAMKFNPNKMAILKQEYDEQWSLAAEEDRDRSSTYLVPQIAR